MEVQSDIIYKLFQTTSPFPENKYIPALELGLPEGKDIQMDELVFIYSPADIRKPSLILNTVAKMYFMKFSEFDLWKTSAVQANPETVVKSIAISIIK